MLMLQNVESYRISIKIIFYQVATILFYNYFV